MGYIKTYEKNPESTGPARTFKGNSKNREKINKELARRKRVIEKRVKNPKYKGTILTIGALSILAGLITPGIALNSTKHTQEFSKTISSSESTATENSLPDRIVDEKTIGDIVINKAIDSDSSRVESEQEGGTVQEIDNTNITEVLEIGDVIEFEGSQAGVYEYSFNYGGMWSVVPDTKDVNNEKWCFACDREIGNYGYVPLNSIEEFKPYKTKQEGLIYRNELNGKDDGTGNIVIDYGRINCSQGSIVYIDDSQKYVDENGYELYKILVQTEVEGPNLKNYKYTVGFTDEFQIEKSENQYSLGLVTERTTVRSEPQIQGDIYTYEQDTTDKGVKYILDISSYDENNFQDYRDTIESLKAKGLLGGVIMEIARSKTFANQSFSIGCMTGNYELDEKNKIIESQTSNTSTYSMGDYEQFKKYVEETINVCPIGFYVYVDTINEKNASQLAEIVKETEEKINEDVVLYDVMPKFPIMVDVEDGKDNERQQRTDTIVGFINELADYNVIKDQYMFYTSPAHVVAKKEDERSGAQITSIEEVKERTNDLTLINVGALYVDGMLNTSTNSNEFKDNLNPENLLDSMSNNKYYTESYYISKKNIEQADIMQCMGNINNDTVQKLKLNRQLIDISVCTTDTYNQILNGTFKGHQGTYLGNIADSIANAKIKNNKNKSNYQIQNDFQSQKKEKNERDERDDR